MYLFFWGNDCSSIPRYDRVSKNQFESLAWNTTKQENKVIFNFTKKLYLRKDVIFMQYFKVNTGYICFFILFVTASDEKLSPFFGHKTEQTK